MSARPELGAHLTGGGATFAVFSSVADAVEVCLFDDAGRETRHPLEQEEGYVWTGQVEGAAPGYGSESLRTVEWSVVVDTADGASAGGRPDATVDAAAGLTLDGRSLVLLGGA